MSGFKIYHLLTSLILAVFLLVPAPAQAEAVEKATGTIVATSGYWEQNFNPDTGEITLGVQTEAATVAAAQNQNAKTANNVLEQILAIGLKKEAIKTINYSVIPIYQIEDKNSKKQTISGYRVSNSIIVTTSPDKVAQVIDVALKSGANRVNSLRFSLKDDKKAKQDTIALAVKDALAKIDSIAQSLDRKVKRIQTVNEHGTNIRALEVASKMMLANDASMSETTPISSGTITISSSVQVTAELE